MAKGHVTADVIASTLVLRQQWLTMQMTDVKTLSRCHFYFLLSGWQTRWSNLCTLVILVVYSNQLTFIADIFVQLRMHMLRLTEQVVNYQLMAGYNP